MKALRCVVVWLSMVPVVAWGAGLSHNDHFIVMAPSQSLADKVLAKATAYRTQIAQELFGKELPRGSARTIINVSLSNSEDNAVTWPIDSPDRKFHKVWLTTSEEKAVGNALRHEMVHVVLSTQFSERLPKWVEEGLAGRGDDAHRLQTRQRIIDSYAQTGNWPDLNTILDSDVISSDDQAAYSVAGSLTEYLLSQGDMAKLLKFAVAKKASGWDEALRQHYHIATLDQLQQNWRRWAGRTTHAGNRVTPVATSVGPEGALVLPAQGNALRN